MSTRKKRIGISGKLVVGTHDDLIERWEAIPLGERQGVLIDALIAWFKLPPTQRRDPLGQVRADTAWIKQAMVDLPAYLEEVIARVAVSAPARPPATPVSDAGLLSEDEARQRDEAMRKRKW